MASDRGYNCHMTTFVVLAILIMILISIPQARTGILWVVSIWLTAIAWNKRYELCPSRKQMFVVSCIAVSCDPLFLYIPIVDENNKCLGVDKKLRTAALVLRSLTDVPSVLHIIHQIHRLAVMPKVEASWWMDGLELHKLHEEMRLRIRRIRVHIAIYFLAVLPVPQVMILVIFLRKRDSIIYTRTPIVAYLVLQYLVRAYQIYQSCMKFKRVRRWLKGAFNFLLYILAAHVLGAFWYFTSIERETTCWQKACKSSAGCRTYYYCNNTSSASKNIALLSESCPINPSNTTLFDFGIYLDILQSGNTGAVGFLTKYFYTFWWGIKNLSNFGTNLEPSSYTWESCFAIIICTFGLLLFMYLIGNVQTYIQMETQKTLSIEDETIKTKYEDINTWMSESDLLEDMKMEIIKRLKEKRVVEKHPDVDVDLNFLLSVAPTGLKTSIKEHTCINALKKVHMLHKMSEVSLRMMCAYAKPKIYQKNSYIFREGKPLDKMIIIIKGTTICSNAEELKTPSSMITEQRIRQKGDFYGEKLLEWEPSAECPTLISKQDVHCQTKVEALVFTLESEMESVKEYWQKRQWDQNFTPRVVITETEEKIEKILNKMYEQSGTKRKVKFKEIEEELVHKRNIMFKEKAILEWVSRNGLPEDLKTEIMTNMKVSNEVGINADADVDVKWLNSTDLPEHIDTSIRKHLCMNTLKRVPVLENMDEDVLLSICKHLEPVVYTDNSYLCRTGDRLEFMLIIIEGIFVWTNGQGDAATNSSALTTRGIVKGDFCGEDILSYWASPNNSFSAPTPAPIWNRDIKCQKKVEGFALTVEKLRQVVSENQTKWHHSFSNFASTSGTTEHRALEQIIKVQGDILREQLLALVRESMLQFRDDMATQARRLDEITEFLGKSGYPGTLPPAP